MKRLASIFRHLFHRQFYAILDPNDTSVTFSKKLWHDIDNRNIGNAKVYVFYIPELRVYGFIINPSLDEETQLCDIQYSETAKTIGFETLCPTVSKIAMDYSLPYDTPSKLTVKRRKLKNGTRYYTFERPL